MRFSAATHTVAATTPVVERVLGKNDRALAAADECVDLSSSHRALD